MRDVLSLSARDAVDALRRKELSPIDLIEAAEDCIRVTDPAINALPTLCLDRARRRAGEMIIPDEPPPGFLFGLPIAIKDLTDVEGVRTTYGSLAYKDHVPNRSDILVELLEARGAIVVGKSNTSEFGAGAQTFNDVFGVTKNPWDTKLTAGGSSGGSAAALAARQVWLATGTDLGGSLRIPASFCGVVGLRPSPGLLPHGPTRLPKDTLNVAGPMARNVGDLALCLDAWVGNVGKRHGVPQLESYLSSFNRAPSVVPRRPVAFSDDLALLPVDREVRSICRMAAKLLESSGFAVEERAPDLHDAEDIFLTLRAEWFAAVHAEDLRLHRRILKPELAQNIEQGIVLTTEDVDRARLAQVKLRQRLAEFFETYDILVCPTVAVPPFDHRIRYVTEIDGTRFRSYISWCGLTFAFSITGCSVLSVPAGLTSEGKPIGVQLVAPSGEERRLLSIAAILEDAVGPLDIHRI